VETAIKAFRTPIVAAVVAVTFVVGAYLMKFWGNPISGDPSNWGALGDYVGGILNPVFGFVTIIILLYTVVLQAKELNKSVAALQAQKEELEKTSEIAERQFRLASEQSRNDAIIKMIATIQADYIRELNQTRIIEANSQAVTLEHKMAIALAKISDSNEVKNIFFKGTYIDSSVAAGLISIASSIQLTFDFIEQLDDGSLKRNLSKYYSGIFSVSGRVLYILGFLDGSGGLKNHEFYIP
jgi:uncharacterized membrane protein